MLFIYNTKQIAKHTLLGTYLSEHRIFEDINKRKFLYYTLVRKPTVKRGNISIKVLHFF